MCVEMQGRRMLQEAVKGSLGRAPSLPGPIARMDDDLDRDGARSGSGCTHEVGSWALSFVHDRPRLRSHAASPKVVLVPGRDGLVVVDGDLDHAAFRLSLSHVLRPPAANGTGCIAGAFVLTPFVTLAGCFAGLHCVREQDRIMEAEHDALLTSK